MTKLERMLIVNDDIEDVLAIQERLPEEIEVDVLSQFRARMLEEMSGYDLIIIDNDANDLKESKGKDTLQEIRSKNQEVPVIYTSFQPGWVDASVFQTNGVEVVRTDGLVDRIGQRFSVPMKEPQIREGPEPEMNIIMTYNFVEGYEPGLYSNGRLLIVSYDKTAGIDAKRVLREQVRQVYKDFEWRADRDLIRNIFVYDGINGGNVPGAVAQSLGHDVRMKVNLLACHCDWERKERLRNSSNVELYKVQCGGFPELGAIADVILGVKRPGVLELPIPEEKILGRAERMVL